jgi:hypothetical protein
MWYRRFIKERHHMEKTRTAVSAAYVEMQEAENQAFEAADTIIEALRDAGMIQFPWQLPNHAEEAKALKHQLAKGMLDALMRSPFVSLPDEVAHCYTPREPSAFVARARDLMDQLSGVAREAIDVAG